MSPALAGGFFTVPEKSRSSFLIFVRGVLDTQKFIPKADTCRSWDRSRCSHSKSLSKGPDLLSYFCIPFNTSSTVRLQSYCKGPLCVKAGSGPVLSAPALWGGRWAGCPDGFPHGPQSAAHGRVVRGHSDFTATCS